MLQYKSHKDFPNLAQYIPPVDLQEKSHELSLDLSDFLAISGAKDTASQTEWEPVHNSSATLDTGVQTDTEVLDAADDGPDPLASSTQQEMDVSQVSQQSASAPAKKRQKVDNILSQSTQSVILSPPAAVIAATTSTPVMPTQETHGFTLVSVESLAVHPPRSSTSAPGLLASPTLAPPATPPQSTSTATVKSSDGSIFLASSSPEGSSVTGSSSASKSKSADSGDSVQITFDSNLLDCQIEDCGECEKHAEEGADEIGEEGDEEEGEEEEGEEEEGEEEEGEEEENEDLLILEEAEDWDDYPDLIVQDDPQPRQVNRAELPAFFPQNAWYLDPQDSTEMAYIHHTWYRNRPQNRAVRTLPDGSMIFEELCDDCLVGEFTITLPQDAPHLADKRFLPLFKVLQHQLRVLHNETCRNTKCQEVGEIDHVLSLHDLEEQWAALLALGRWYSSYRFDGLHDLSFALQYGLSRLSDPLQDMKAAFMPCYTGYQLFPADAGLSLLEPPPVVDLAIAEVKVNSNIRTMPTVHRDATPVECFSCKVCYDSSPQYWVIYMNCM